MKSFFVGVALAVALAVATGFGLSAAQIGSESFNSTENVRL